ncbi:hypothetical protein E2C01_071367 [Portunus trituberculatus]|uniref:Uncharacterized protein n=1 Tax=Portunus trituberculatus TaxID=210409 RepID=A0A5B7HV62_PORTR|nr:hypothetical protein [Portunus trituberculatus]
MVDNAARRVAGRLSGPDAAAATRDLF